MWSRPNISARLAFLALACLAQAGAVFVPPADGPVPFRRDRLPLDVDAISGLSTQLSVLAQTLVVDSPETRRSAAQILALAAALDPANEAPRRLIEKLSAGREKPAPETKIAELGRARVWQTIGWLESTAAGADGNALADCLKDVIVVSDPGHPRSAALRAAGEKGAWNDWIPPLSAYQTPAPLPPTTNGETEPAPPPNPGDAPATPPAGIAMDRAEIRVPMWRREGSPESPAWAPAMLPLGMTAAPRGVDEETGKPRRFSLRIGTNDETSDRLRPMEPAVRNALERHHGSLPNGIRITISSPEFETSLESRRSHSIGAAAAVLASSALSGNPPAAIVLGNIDEQGNYVAPAGLWGQLTQLGKGNGERLVLPTSASAQLPSFLALEKPEFFMEYEVLLASDVSQLLDFAAKTPPGPIAEFLARFREIRDKAGNQDLRLYIGNRFIRQRLVDISLEMPGHFSARMLAIQAAGNRPTTVSRDVLAAELARAVQPMAWLDREAWQELNSAERASLGALYETCRQAVDKLDRYATKPDLELVSKTKELILKIRDVERASRARGESWEVQEGIRRAQQILAKSYKSVVDDLLVESGAKSRPKEE